MKIKRFDELNEAMKEHPLLPDTTKILDNARNMKAPEFMKWWKDAIKDLKIEKK